MRIKKLLFVTKFEDLCYNSLDSLLNLTKASLEHVVFLNVIEKEKVSMHRGAGFIKEEEVKLKETANIRFIDWAENLFELGLEVGAHINVGSLIPEIIKTVEQEKPDLIVIGRSHKGPLEHLYSKSEVTELIRRISIPVLVFKHINEDNIVPEKIFSRPLLATNWSDPSKKATEYINDIKELIDELNVMHVTNEKNLKSKSTHLVQKIRRQERKKLDDLCDTFENNDIRTRAHVYVGDPEKEIIKAAKEYQASMIILGSSSKTSIVERWMGSTTRTIAEKSIFPCLLIPYKK
ncbi:MAG: universal stress protein [Desulfobacteraceae bacterium]|nr:universal stress protein [Desulfobacteraceae bacterium]